MAVVSLRGAMSRRGCGGLLTVCKGICPGRQGANGLRPDDVAAAASRLTFRGRKAV